MSRKLWSITIVFAVVFSLAITPILTTSAASPYSSRPERLLDSSGGAQPVLNLQSDKSLPSLGNYDVRATNITSLSNIIKQHSTLSPNALNALARLQIATARAGLANLKVASPGAEATFSPLTGAVEVVRNRQTALTAAAPGRAGSDIVLDYLRAYPTVYGLTDAEIDDLQYLGESVSGNSGLRMVRFEQQVNGLPVFQSETRFILDQKGRLISTLGLMIPQANQTASGLTNLMQPQQALQAALASVKLMVDPSTMQVTPQDQSGHQVEIVSTDAQIAGPVSSRLIYFPVVPGVLIPAWSEVVFTSGSADWYILVDAQTGTLLWRKNIRSDGDTVKSASAVPQQPAAPSASGAVTHQPERVVSLIGSTAPTSSTQDARFSVYVQADGSTPADNPAPHSPTTVTVGSGTQFPEITRTIVSMLAVQNLVASPDGWISDGITTTTGNNVDAYLDTDGNNAPDAALLDVSGRPGGNLDSHGNNRDFLGSSPRDYGYAPAPVGGNPNAGDAPTNTPYRRGAVTQLFYLSNWYHDQLYALGFDEAAGNYQTNNFGRGGTGNDPVLAEAQDGSGTNNANFATPPDGQSGRMQMYRFTSPNPDRDGDLDAEIVLHEMTHGLSNRLIGNSTGLFWDVGGSLGEGWSDFYALSLLNHTNADDPNGEYASGAYATYQLGGLTDNYLYGIRRFPYSTDNTINPLTWADVDNVTYNQAGGIAASPLNFGANGALEVHNAGEIWALTLWEVRSRIIADPAGANGDVPTGNHTMLQIATDALKLTPSNPSFTDARDALIDADCAANGCANEQSIWAGFADRGLGYQAVAPLGQVGFSSYGYIGVGESFSTPYLDVANVVVNDSQGNGNNAIDPGEPIRLNVSLLNPWRNAAKGVLSATATLSTTAPGVTILDNSSTYGTIPAQGTTNGDPFEFRLDPGAICGQSIHFTVQINSALGARSVDFTVRVGTATGTGAPITYTHTIAGGRAIPDNAPLGISDQQTIADDYEIADLNFRVDDLRHTFTGDLIVGLKAPNGYGTSLIWLRQTLFIGGGDGDNFINTVIDDESVNDLNQSPASAAPFTGNWLPAFNSPVWNLFGDPSIFPDPVGHLSRVDGLSTQGNWKVFVSDNFSADTGTLNTWSLIVTPRAFTCAAFTPADLAVSKTVTPSLAAPGQTVTYTLNFANSGGFTATNVVLNDNVPAQLVSVSFANSGSTITATPGITYSWHVANLAPGAGGVITLTGQVDPNLVVPTTFTNTATITSTAFEITGTNNTASVPVVVGDSLITGLSATNSSPTVLGAATSFTATASGSNISYAWNFGDNAVGSGATTNHSYGAAGFYTAIVTASNSSYVVTATTAVTITNAAPAANAGPDQNVAVDSAVALDGSGSVDPDGHAITYGWQQTSGLPVVLSSAVISRPTFTAPTTATVLMFTLVVTDAYGLSSLPDSVVITVTDTPPTGLVAVNDSPTVIGHATTFTATASGGNINYTWNFGDNTTGSGATATHTYTVPGFYTAIVTASNSLSMVTATTAVTITNAAPTAHAGPDQNASVNAVVALDGSGSVDPDGHAITYGWQQTGGLPVVLSSPIISRPTFTAPTTATVLAFTLVVTDAYGLSSSPDTVVITVTDAPLAGLVAVNDSPTVIGHATTFTASLGSLRLLQPNSATVYTWNYGDGQTGTGAVSTHTYTTAGSYTAIVTASNSSYVVTATTAVTITNVRLLYMPLVTRNFAPASVAAVKDVGAQGRDIIGLIQDIAATLVRTERRTVLD